METALRTAIEKQSRKLLVRFHKTAIKSREYERRFAKRTGKPAAKATVRRPGVWDASPHFDPIYCIKHSKFLARIIWKRILDRSYQVSPAVLFQIPKDSGGFRDVMVFSIPDAAVANLFNRKMRDRNRNIQSPLSYAYRKDRGIFDAVLRLSSLIDSNKTYVTQYDFSKYFDTIKHDYLNFIIEKGDFSISPAERFVIAKFLCHKFSLLRHYKMGNFQVRSAGVPQGSSLSLFLSNIAGHELDQELEKYNGSFVRFADDIVSVTHEFQDALKVTEAFKEHCYYSGISININKSPGIKLLETNLPGSERRFFIDNQDVGDIGTLAEFDYIGHKFRVGSILMSSNAFRRVKKRISSIIYIHLLHNLKRGFFNPNRLGANFLDWDLVTCINELRAYIYGGLNEQVLRRFIENNERISRFRGLMSFYALVSSIEQFKILDGWLLSVLRRALAARAKLLIGKFGITPSTFTAASLLTGSWYTYNHEVDVETKLPSFVIAWRAARKAYRQYGLTDFQKLDYYSSLIM